MAKIFVGGGGGGGWGWRRKNTVKTLAVRLGGKDNLCAKTYCNPLFIFEKKVLS